MIRATDKYGGPVAFRPECVIGMHHDFHVQYGVEGKLQTREGTTIWLNGGGSLFVQEYVDDILEMMEDERVKEMLGHE